MKKFKLQEIEIHMGLFDFTIHCVIGDYKEAQKYVMWKFEDDDLDLEIYDNGYNPRGKCFFRKGYVPIIWIPKKPKTPREHATLTHECIHAVWRMFEWASLPMTEDNEEVLTHSTAHLVHVILSHVK